MPVDVGLLGPESRAGRRCSGRSSTRDSGGGETLSLVRLEESFSSSSDVNSRSVIFAQRNVNSRPVILALSSQVY